MAVSLPELKPYKSFILARIPEESPKRNLVSEVLDSLEELLGLDEKGSRALVTRSQVTHTGDLNIAFIHYVEEQQAPWTTDSRVADRVNHLVLAAQMNRVVAICLSDPRWRDAIVDGLLETAGTKEEDEEAKEKQGLSALEKIPEGILNAAFVRGRAQTLWLSGTHRRISVKADNKILSGVDLRDALDPLSDQSYYFTAARCRAKSKTLDAPVGVTPRGSRIWAGATRTWKEFKDTLTALLRHLEETTKPVKAPLPVVAVSTTKAEEITDPFDIAIAPPPEMIEEEADKEKRQNMETWAYHSSLKIVKTSGASFVAELLLSGETIGAIDFEMDFGDLEHITWKASGEPASTEVRKEFENGLSACRHPKWVKIWYDSGHTMSDGAVFEVRHRDVPFRNFRWVDFAGFDVSKEKPKPLSAIGKKKSLFCWTQRYWPNLDGTRNRRGAWLACDDGSMEIADFIHLDTAGERPVLSLIHVKGAGSDEKERELSVSKYEVVVGQAVKNLRHLDSLLLQDGLSKGVGKKISKLVWHDRSVSTREKMLAVLENVGADFERQVVVIQPHVTRARHDEARKKPDSIEARRLTQLDTLLLSAEATAHGLGAQFIVLAAQ